MPNIGSRVKVSNPYVLPHLKGGRNFYSRSYNTRIQFKMTDADLFDDEDNNLSSVLQKASFDEIRYFPNKPTRAMWMSKKYLLEDFRPKHSPFVPTFLVVVINIIEKQCSDAENTDFWLVHYVENERDTFKSRLILQDFLQNNYSHRKIKKLLEDVPLRILTSMLREFFSLLPKRLIWVKRNSSSQLSNKPLYDYLLRVNPHILFFIKQSVLQMSRTGADTLAFMMVHVLHLWEYSFSPNISKNMIADIYGSWIIKFEGKTTVSRHSGVQSAESLLLLAMMDATDTTFWNTFSAMKVCKLFKNFTPFDRKRMLRKSFVSSVIFKDLQSMTGNILDAGGMYRFQYGSHKTDEDALSNDSSSSKLYSRADIDTLSKSLCRSQEKTSESFESTREIKSYSDDNSSINIYRLGVFPTHTETFTLPLSHR